jgi:hypothetical protein
MSMSSDGDAPAGTRDFLRERLARGNECLGAGNARGALHWYDSALTAFAESGYLPELRETWRALWHNKAIAHQQLGEPIPAEDALRHAHGLRPL